MIKVTATLINKDGAYGYIHGSTIKDVWTQVEKQIKVDQTFGVTLQVQRTRRVSGSHFRYCDPANPANEQNSYTYFIITKQYTEARDFTTTLIKTKTDRDSMFSFLQKNEE
jgi:hypothetical protein